MLRNLIDKILQIKKNNFYKISEYVNFLNMFSEI